MARKPKHAPIAQTFVPTIIEFLLDETGSMSSCKGQTIGGYNDFLTEQRSQDGKCLLTLTKFDSYGQRTPYIDLNIEMVPEMNDNTFIPGGMTNLRDTIGERIASLKQRVSTWTTKPNVLFVVMTDGDDNSSREFSEGTVKETIERHTEEGWTFVYLGADQDALKVASRLGFQDGNVKSFASSEMRETMRTLATATTAYRAAGTSVSKSFFAQ
jgi:hypothetical protein